MRWSCRSTFSFAAAPFLAAAPHTAAALFVAVALCWLATAPEAVAASEPVIVHAAGTSDGAPAEDREPLSARELEALVGPVALYPDDLLAIVLPASTYPLQIVQAARYLEALEQDASLEPDEDWDESVVALLNYPEVVEKLNEDLDWTAALGQAVLEQEEELLDAVDSFRRMAYAAGNLPSDRRQRVEVEDAAIRIRHTDPAVIYVPYYEPSLVRTRHAYPVYHYYSRPCPVYYYPYPAGHYLASRHFWGMTGAYSIAWRSRDLHFYLLQHRSHPYYGHDYAFRHYRYWRPRLLDDHHDRFRHRDRDRLTSRWQPDYRLRDDQRQARDDVPFTRPSAGTILDRLQRYQEDADKARRFQRREHRDSDALGSSSQDHPLRSVRRARAAEPRSAASRVERRMRYEAPRESRSAERIRSTRRSVAPERASVRASDGSTATRAETRARTSAATRGSRVKYRSD